MPTNEEAAQVAGILLIVLDILTVAGRFYSRWVTKLGFRWDDWTILMALITGILPGALTMYASTVSATGPAAASNHNPDYVFTPEDIVYTKITFSTSVLYFFITSITKLSILLLLHRLFSISDRFRMHIYIAEAAVVAFWFSATIADCLNCIPLEWTWKNGNADPRYCINFNTFWLGTGIAESIIDLWILLLPIFMVSSLHLERNKRFGVAGIFLMGGFVLFSGIAKVVLSYQPNSREPDFSRGTLWTTVHMYTGILCANLPTARPLLNQIAHFASVIGSRMSMLSTSRGGKRWYSLSGRQSSSRSDDVSGEEGKGKGDFALPMWSLNSYRGP